MYQILFSKTHEVGLILFGAEGNFYLYIFIYKYFNLEAEDGNTYYIREISKPDCNFFILFKGKKYNHNFFIF